MRRQVNAEFEIIGPPEIRDVDPDERYFNPAIGDRRIDRAGVGNVGAVIAVPDPRSESVGA